MPQFLFIAFLLLSVDIMELNNGHYLVIVDRYSKLVELNLLENMTSKNAIKHLKSQFSRFGIPDAFYSDIKRIGYVNLLWHSLSLPNNNFVCAGTC